MFQIRGFSCIVHNSETVVAMFPRPIFAFARGAFIRRFFGWLLRWSLAPKLEIPWHINSAKTFAGGCGIKIFFVRSLRSFFSASEAVANQPFVEIHRPMAAS